MDPVQVVVLALIQGLTEFLPISSSAHLILVPSMTGWADQGLAFDVAVHVGTLAAVVGYFRADLTSMLRGWLCSISGRGTPPEGRLAWAVAFATVPAGIAGLVFDDFVQTELRSPLVIAWATIGFGLLLWWSDARGRRLRAEDTLGWRDVLVIGCAQALALIPGTSRSGITMTAGLMMGLTRPAAARFSFLLAVPLIAAAGLLKTLQLVRSEAAVEWGALALGTAISAFSAYACIHYFLRFLQRIGMLPFVIYRLILGAVLIVWFH